MRKARVASTQSSNRVAMGGQEKLDRYEEQTKCLEAQVIHVKFKK